MTEKKSQPAKGRRYARDGQDLRDAMQPAVPVLPFPDDLPEDWRALWTETVNVNPRDYWTAHDVPLLRLYCRTYFDIERLNAEIEQEGDVIENARGNPVINPKTVVRQMAEQRFLMLCSRIKAQPSSRVNGTQQGKQVARKNGVKAKVDAVAGEDGDGDDGLIAGMGGVGLPGELRVQ